jgi:hypothetical protein
MPKSRSKSTSLPLNVPFFPAKQRKPIPHEFVLEEIASLSPRTRLMFGCLAVYVQQRGQEGDREKIVLFLRDKPASPEDNGVWLATTYEHHESLREEFPRMRSIKVLGKALTGWQVLPADSDDFEKAARRACELVLAHDPRIGKIPGARPKSQAKKRTVKNEKRGPKKKATSPKRRS